MSPSPEFPDLRERDAVLDEIQHLDVHQRGQVIACDVGLAACPVFFTHIEQGLAQPLVGAGVGLGVRVGVSILDGAMSSASLYWPRMCSSSGCGQPSPGVRATNSGR